MVAYAELHCHSNFSFLDGASHPEALVARAAELGLSGLGLTDHDGLYGAVRFASAAKDHGVPTIFGAELTLRPPSNCQGGRSSFGHDMDPDPSGSHLVVLAQGPHGYGRLAAAISDGQLKGRKQRPAFSVETLALGARAPLHNTPADTSNRSWFVLSGCRKGSVPSALIAKGYEAARRELDLLIDAFGRDRVIIELWDHGYPDDKQRNQALADLARQARVSMVATNNVHYATIDQRPLAQALAAVRSRRSLDDLEGWLPASPLAHLRSPAEQLKRFAEFPGSVELAAELAALLSFPLENAAPRLPDYPVPAGHDEMSWLRVLVERGAAHRYPPDHQHFRVAQDQIAHELAVIEQLGFPGYFLLVHDIVNFCSDRNIYCQGRGSAANSAVCYALGITQADAVSLGLLFERFLSIERDGPPDIDIDIEHQRREEVIQYLYKRFDRRHAAQVANVITYRPKSSLREMAKVYGCTPGQADALSKQIDHHWGPRGRSRTNVNSSATRTLNLLHSDNEELEQAEILAESRVAETGIPEVVRQLASQIEGFPRHLGIHSGGMVMADRPIVEYVPVEWARMKNRSILQWDKDDCAAAGLVKFDLLGLGMLTMLHRAVDLIAKHSATVVDLAVIPQEDEVYELLCRADTVGVFQVESRAQMQTLPRLAPRCFYDLVVEVALIRPGPIQGQSVHPYLRRRSGREEVTYLHPLLEPSLRKTLGIPIFQEQLMQMAIDVAGFSAGEADQLRQAMGSKRSRERMAAMRIRLLEGMARRGIIGDVAEEIAQKMEAFADFGFPESHSVSFAFLVYSSSWIKLHYPAEFVCALLNSQPMGFYSQNSIIHDGKRHGVMVNPPDVFVSEVESSLEGRPETDPIGYPAAGWLADPSSHAVRIGLGEVRNLSEDGAARIVEQRRLTPFVDVEDLARRCGLRVPELEALSTAGALSRFGLSRREGLWASGALRDASPDKLPGLVQGIAAPRLPGMDDFEEITADLWSIGMALGEHPVGLVRSDLDESGIVSNATLALQTDRSIVEVAGVVTHRQRPSTAGGVVFLSLEDETGLANIICVEPVWKRYRKIARDSTMLIVQGRVERQDGVVNLMAHRFRSWHPEQIRDRARYEDALKSRNFR
ncbi:MAG: error-prone DNA polymerase [Actinobacteria bacterium]|nr:error-prone DNA polymerase [Actinomycetota bacterium]